MIRFIPPAQLETRAARLIDVREYPEFAAAAIVGSVLVPLSTIEKKAEDWKKTAGIVLICRSGRRALDAAQRLEKIGFTDLAVLEGGVEAGGGGAQEHDPSGEARGDGKRLARHGCHQDDR